MNIKPTKLLLLPMVALMALSCKKEDQGNLLPSNPTLEISQQELSFDFDGSPQTIELESNFEWIVLYDGDAASWVSVTPDKGNPGVEAQSVTITVSENTSTESRATGIRFSHTKGAVSRELVISQNPRLSALQADSVVLRQIYEQCQGQNWWRPWDVTTDISSWGGVTTRLVNGELRVTELDLSSQGLKGKLPESMAKLTELKRLFITKAELKQSPPEWIKDLPKLTHVAFAACKLTGSIPESYYTLSNLKQLDLYENELTGGISEALGGMTSLERMDWSMNPDLGGSIPASIGQLKKLYWINLMENGMSGNIPEEISQCQALTEIVLSGNKFTGALPSFSQATGLKQLDFNDNLLTGELPESWKNCLSLQDIRLSNNSISGSLPASWSTLNELETIQAWNNQISGEIPASWANMKLIANIIMPGNKLTGPIPTFIGRLEEVDLNDNQLTGSIPSQVTGSYSLVTFKVGGNQLSGQVDLSILTSARLQMLDISRMKGCTGKLPVPTADKEYSQSLRDVKLNGCSFSGELPSAFFDNHNLQTLLLDDNDFTGNLPDMIGFAESLDKFSINGNKMAGVLPDQALSHPNWALWKPQTNICPQQQNYGFSNCQ